MTDEEKKAIEIIKGLAVYYDDYSLLDEEEIEENELVNNSITIILNLIEKQQKEIEELKNGQIDFWISDKEIEERIRNKFVSKDKIKAILGIEENIDEEKILSLLQTIVDENARLEDIEDRKVQIEYNNVFNKGVKSVENKIKAKIKEWDMKDLTICYGGKSQGRTFQQAVRTEVKNILQSLIEKE